jgi:hypothetical protein
MKCLNFKDNKIYKENCKSRELRMKKGKKLKRKKERKKKKIKK